MTTLPRNDSINLEGSGITITVAIDDRLVAQAKEKNIHNDKKIIRLTRPRTVNAGWSNWASLILDRWVNGSSGRIVTPLEWTQMWSHDAALTRSLDGLKPTVVGVDLYLRNTKKWTSTPLYEGRWRYRHWTSQEPVWNHRQGHTPYHTRQKRRRSLLFS